MSPNESHSCLLRFSDHHIAVTRFRVVDGEAVVTDSFSEQGNWPFEVDSLQNALQAFVIRHGLTKDRFYWVLPRYDVTVRLLDLPAHDSAEIANMIRFKAEGYVPYPLEELTLAHCTLERLEGGRSRVMAVIAHSDLIVSQLQMLDEAGLDVEDILLSTTCLMNAAQKISDTNDGTVGILDLSPEGFELLVLEDGKPLFTRALALGTSIIDVDGTPRTEELLEELESAFAAYRRESQDGLGIEFLRLSASDSLQSVADEVVQRLPVQCEGITLDMVSSCTRKIPYTISLLPESEKSHRADKGRRKQSWRITLATMIFSIAMVTSVALMVYRQTAYIQELETRVETMRPAVEQVQIQRAHLRRLQSQVASETTPLELFGAIVELAPEQGLNLTRFDYRNGEGITLQGSAIEYRSFDKLLDDMRAVGRSTIPQFLQAQEVYRVLRRERGHDVWSYSISIPFVEEDVDE